MANCAIYISVPRLFLPRTRCLDGKMKAHICFYTKVVHSWLSVCGGNGGGHPGGGGVGGSGGVC